jgi:hemoglobin-like flavoprotein
MASSLFPQMMQNNPINKITNLVNLMRGKNVDAMYNMMMQNNPQFANFVNQNKGKSAEQIANENGIDFNAIKQFLR